MVRGQVVYVQRTAWSACSSSGELRENVSYMGCARASCARGGPGPLALPALAAHRLTGSARAEPNRTSRGVAVHALVVVVMAKLARSRESDWLSLGKTLILTRRTCANVKRPRSSAHRFAVAFVPETVLGELMWPHCPYVVALEAARVPRPRVGTYSPMSPTPLSGPGPGPGWVPPPEDMERDNVRVGVVFSRE